MGTCDLVIVQPQMHDACQQFGDEQPGRLLEHLHERVAGFHEAILAVIPQRQGGNA